MRLRGLAALCVSVTFMTDCASTPAGEGVEFHRLGPEPEALLARDRIRSSCVLLKTDSYGSEGGIRTRNKVRTYAAAISADAVLWTEYNDSGDWTSRAEFYRCRPAASSK